MCNSRLMISGLCLALVAVLSSCALPKQPLLTYFLEKHRSKAGPLESGKTYEVRKALDTRVPFRPAEIKRYTFVFEAAKPPPRCRLEFASHFSDVRAHHRLHA